ncbi:MAG: carbohydrate kinase [Armatimonadetes bacterium]|nr:carbohydrate kinase [Akkermansiaceae bacterium]
MFLGLDSSTQSLSAIIIDPASRKIIASHSVNFGRNLPQYLSPNGFIPEGKNGEVHSNPLMWLDALDLLFRELSENADLSRIEIIAGSGQQHGSVYFNAKFDHSLSTLDPAQSLSSQLSSSLTRKTSPIWMDTSTGEECAEITASVGGSSEVCARSGSNAIERFTGPQIRRFWKTDPDAYGRTSRIHLVSSFIASVLAGKSMPIDFGDGAGMNLLNLGDLEWDAGLLNATAPELDRKLPPPVSCLTALAGISTYFSTKYGISSNCKICPFTGDNPASLVGMGATTPGQVVISLGTSDTYFAAMPTAKTDPQGYGHVFGNPAGGFMSLICFRNGSLARECLRDELHVDWSAFEKESLLASSDSAGKNLTLPFYGAEITPRYDFEKPVTDFTEEQTPGRRIRSLLEGQFLNMRLHSQWMGVTTERIRLTGGASQNDGIAQLVADVFQAPVERLEVENSAALGAALIAATAMGNDLVEMQNIYCKPASNSLLQPNTELGEVYSSALGKYAKLLKMHIKS